MHAKASSKRPGSGSIRLRTHGLESGAGPPRNELGIGTTAEGGKLHPGHMRKCSNPAKQRKKPLYFLFPTRRSKLVMLSGGRHALKCFIWTCRKPGEVKHYNSSSNKAPGEHRAAENIQLQENTAFTPGS